MKVLAEGQLVECITMELERVKKEVAHWKNNHRCEVERARVLKERTDMPLERVKAYEQIGSLQSALAEMEAQRDQWQRLHDELAEKGSAHVMRLQSALSRCRAELETVKGELEIFKRFDSMTCPDCHGIGERTVFSGQTPDSYQEDTVECGCITAIKDRYRADALEEAARECEKRMGQFSGYGYLVVAANEAGNCADAIRALQTTPPSPSYAAGMEAAAKMVSDELSVVHSQGVARVLVRLRDAIRSAAKDTPSAATNSTVGEAG